MLDPMDSDPDRARAFVFIATSVDGFIARRDGGIDWLERANATLPPGEDCGYGAFFALIDALVMGRHTFDLVRRFDPWPYGDKPVIVLSRHGVAVPAPLRDRVSVSAEAPQALLRRLGAAGLTRVYVDGGLTVQSFLHEGLIDELTVTTVPVLLGEGRSLFGALAGDVALELVESRHWPFGFVQNRWRVRPRDEGVSA
jgi:dihydrofolate reductase